MGGKQAKTRQLSRKTYERLFNSLTELFTACVRFSNVPIPYQAVILDSLAAVLARCTIASGIPLEIVTDGLKTYYQNEEGPTEHDTIH